MSKKVFLDANCVIDLMYRRDLSYSASLDTVELSISALSVHIAVYVAKDVLPSEWVKQFFQYVDVVGLDAEILLKSMEGPTQDLEDNIQLNSALQVGAERFLTKDKTLLALKTYEGMTIQSPLHQ